MGNPTRPARRHAGAASDRATTEVIGTILLLVVAVGLAGSFVLFLFTVPPPTPEPHARVATYILPMDPDTVVLEHRGGESIALADLAVRVSLDGALTTVDVGERLDAADPAWAVLAADGTAKTSSQRFAPGDRILFTDAAVPGAAVEVFVADAAKQMPILAALAIQSSDATEPTLSSAETTSTTTFEVTFSEALATIDPADFTVTTPARTISAVTLVGNGSIARFTVSVAWTSDATPTITAIGSPTGTTDVAGNTLLGGASVTATDGVAPAISSVGLVGTPDDFEANVTWTTDEVANSTVYYGPTYSLGLAETGASGTTHDVVLTDLTESSLVLYAVASTDAAGNTATSAVAAFLTGDDGSGGGGSGGASASEHLELSGVPSTLDASTTSAAITVTLKDADGATVASTATVTLVTNSTRGFFLDPAGTTIVRSVTLSAGTTTFRYVDHRSDGGASVLGAFLADTHPATASIPVASHGSLGGGNGASALRAYLLFPGTERVSTSTIPIGIALANPTASSITVNSLSIAANPSPGSGANSFFRAAYGESTGSDDVWETCTLPSGNLNTVTCDPGGSGTSFTLPAYGLTQWVMTFQTSGKSSDDMSTLVGSFVTSLGTVASDPVTVRHSGSSSGPLVTFLPRVSSGGADAGAFGSADMTALNGGSAATFNWRWTFPGTHSNNDVLVTRIIIPMGWSSVTVPSQALVTTTGAVLSVHHPDADESGWIEVRQSNIQSSGADVRQLQFTAVPPDITGLFEFDVHFGTTLGSSSANTVVAAGAYKVPVRIQ